MNRDYPVAYRRGAARHSAARLSSGGGNPAALSSALGATESARSDARDARMRSLLQAAIQETNERKRRQGRSAFPKSSRPGRSQVPRSDVRRVAKGLARSLAKHPLASALRAAVSMLNDSKAQAGAVYRNATASLGGQSGNCPIVEPLDYSDIRPGAPSTACFTAQAVGPDYGAQCSLGVGIWVKRALGFNYNQLWWQLPVPGQTTQQCVDRVYKAGWNDALYNPLNPTDRRYQGMALPGYKFDPQSQSNVQKPQVQRVVEPTVHPHVDPLAISVRAWQPAAVALPTVAVSNREGAGPGVGGEQSSWTSSDPVTKTQPEMLPVAPRVPPTRGRKERKAVVGAQLYRLLGMMTEEMDAIGALYPCIPKHLRTAEFKGRRLPVSLEEKAVAVYRHWDQINLQCAAFNLLWERFEDAAYAKTSKWTKNPFMKGRANIAGGRSLQISQQGDADLPHGSLPLDHVKSWLEQWLGVKGRQ